MKKNKRPSKPKEYFKDLDERLRHLYDQYGTEKVDCSDPDEEDEGDESFSPRRRLLVWKRRGE